MSILVFNTLQYVKKLRHVGISQEQAEAQVEMIANIIQENPVTKYDPHDTELTKLKHALELKIISLENKLRLTWFFGALLIYFALFVACFKFIAN